MIGALFGAIKKVAGAAKKIKGKVDKARKPISDFRKDWLGKGDADEDEEIGGKKYKTTGRINWRS
jgi:hypothetical protein